MGVRELKIVDDKLGTPTYTVDFAEGILRVIENAPYGLYNQVCAGAGSRYDVALEFVRLLGLAEAAKVQKVDSAHFFKDYFAPRPRSEQLRNKRLEHLGLNVMRDWRICLADYSKSFPL